eukprot:5688919-Pleurochrysis_carterae.AAC.3
MVPDDAGSTRNHTSVEELQRRQCGRCALNTTAASHALADAQRARLYRRSYAGSHHECKSQMIESGPPGPT